jgi:hypothetical protein
MINEILNGWENFLVKSEVTEELAKSRATKCDVCIYKKYSKTIKAFVKDDLIEVEGFVCLKCPSIIKCPLSAKIRSEKSKCEIGEW